MLDNTSTYLDIMKLLKELGRPEVVDFKNKKFGIKTNNSYGVFQKELNKIAKQIRPNDALAIQLFDSGIYDAQILCSKIFIPKWGPYSTCFPHIMFGISTSSYVDRFTIFIYNRSHCFVDSSVG